MLSLTLAQSQFNIVCSLPTQLLSSTMAGDADSLFGNATGTKRPLDEDSEKRKLLRRYDHLAVQALNPWGVSDLDKANLPQIWQLLKNGNKTTKYFAEWADEDDYRKGIAVSRLAQVLSKTIEVLKDPKFKQLLDQKVLEIAMKEALVLLPHVDLLNGGKCSEKEQRVTMSSLGQTNDGPIRVQSDVERSAKVLYEWLNQDQSTLRGMISFLSQGGVFYAAAVAEKGARSYVKCSTDKEADFVKAAVARLCKKAPISEAAPDDTSILFTTPAKEKKAPRPQFERCNTSTKRYPISSECF